MTLCDQWMKLTNVFSGMLPALRLVWMFPIITICEISPRLQRHEIFIFLLLKYDNFGTDTDFSQENIKPFSVPPRFPELLSSQFFMIKP